MGKRIDVLPLEELYDRKITPGVLKYILQKEDFTKIQEGYCSKVCRLPEECQKPGGQKVKTDPVDILVVFPHKSPPTPRDSEEWKLVKQDDKNLEIINEVAKEEWGKDLTWAHAYALKCRPEGKKPKMTSIRVCTPYLGEEILARRPKIVLGLGTDVGKALGLAKSPRGRLLEVSYRGVSFHLICTIHPKTLTMIRQNASGDFWGPDYLDIMKRDFKKIKAIASGALVPQPLESVIARLRERNIQVVTSVEEVKKFILFLKDQLRKDPQVVLAWDTETTGLDPWDVNAKFLCHQFGYKDTDGTVKSIVIPLWHRENKFYDPAQAWPFVAEILKSEKIVKVVHNGAFDMVYTRVVMGIEPKNVSFDTMLLLHSWNSGLQGQYDLKTSTMDLLFEEQLAGYDDTLKLDDKDEEEEEGGESESVGNP